MDGANYVKIKGINFFATTLNLTNNSDDNIIEECNFYFPSASKRMLGLTNGLGSTNVTSISNNSDDNTIKKCLFENSEGEALVIWEIEIQLKIIISIILIGAHLI